MNHSPPPHPNEPSRLATLRSLRILDTEADASFDQLTRLAARICGTPISLVSLVDADRQWFKSRVGLDATETPREVAFCAHAILGDEVFIVEDAAEDARFRDNPLVRGAPDIRFYAGVPIKYDRQPLGTLCVIDRAPKRLTKDQRSALNDLAGQVEQLLKLKAMNNKLQQRNDELMTFTGALAHDIKSPINNIQSLVEIILEDHPDIEPEVVEMVQMMGERVEHLQSMITGLFEFWRMDRREQMTTLVDLNVIVEEIFKALPEHHAVRWHIDRLPSLSGAPVEFQQIFLNLMSNALKYNDKPTPEVWLSAEDRGAYWRIAVRDNGPGVPSVFHQYVFEPLKRLTPHLSEPGMGLGLAIVRRLVLDRGGRVGVESDGESGSTFWFDWPGVGQTPFS